MNQLNLIIALFLIVKIYAQDKRELISGIIISDSISVENVHVFNKTLKKGTISNKKGEFKIYAKEKDTLCFSSIQYQTKWVVIDPKQINDKILKIKLFQKINNLPEVVVTNMAKSLGLPNAGKKPLNKLERNLNAYSQESLPIVIIATLLGQQGGIDDIYNIISGNRKRDRKLKSLLDTDKKNETTQEFVQSIRDHFHDEFFINTLKIPKENINTFLNYCLPKDIIFLFKQKRDLDLVDIFLKESKTYKNNK